MVAFDQAATGLGFGLGFRVQGLPPRAFSATGEGLIHQAPTCFLPKMYGVQSYNT